MNEIAAFIAKDSPQYAKEQIKSFLKELLL